MASPSHFKTDGQSVRPSVLASRLLWNSWSCFNLLSERYGFSRYEASSLTRRRGVLLLVLLSLSVVTIQKIKLFTICTICIIYNIYDMNKAPPLPPYLVQASQSRLCHICPILFQKESLVTWTVVGLTAARFKKHTFWAWIHLVLCCEKCSCV